MGGANSKRVKENTHPLYERPPAENDADSNDADVDSETERDKQCTQIIKKDLSETPELFVLNNMLMSIMFFENYQKDIEEAVSKRYEKCETCITPGIVLEKANKNVMYQPLHGPKKSLSERLVVKRLYVLNDAINVVNHMNLDYGQDDLGSYHYDNSTVLLEESPRKGYVKLREMEPPTSFPVDEDIPIAQDEPTPSTSRSSTDSDTTYDYPTLTDIKTPKPIELLNELEKKDTKLNLPGSCIAYRKVMKKDIDLDMENDDLQNISQNVLYDTVSYVSSKGFMKYFHSSLFPNSIGLNLGFDSEQLSMAKSIPGKIFCNITEANVSIPCEVMPSINMQWPLKQTFEFQMKAKTEARKRTIFPTERMINEIKALNCVLVPKGYVKKRGEHLDGDIEWEIHFPQAEKYLCSFMHHAQAKSFLFLLTLHKTYIESKTLQFGLLPDHIRHFFLWECESNYTQWPEHRLGTKLVHILKKFNGFLSKRHLPDYFVSEKNLFEDVPKKYLTHAQKVFHDILETPVMSFMKSLRNLRYTRGTFYPPFDFNRLHQILVTSGIELTNPQILSDMLIPPNYRKKKYTDPEAQLNHIMEIKRREKEILKRQQQAENGNLTNHEEKRESVESIKMDWECEKQFDPAKKTKLLTFFIDNFINIADKCAQLSTHNQTKFYLKQAKYLTKILEDECATERNEAKEYMTKIKNREEQYNRRAARNGENLPPIPGPSVHFPKNFSNTSRESVVKVNGNRPRKTIIFAEIH